MLEEAIADASARCAAIDPRLFDFLRDLLLMQVEGAMETDFALRFQQLTGPAMAKGAEDTAFYNYNRLLCLNEVGCYPGRFGHAPEVFHRFCQEQQKDWPRSMLATSTHDTKRSEDVRARLALLSEMPERWETLIERWHELTAPHRSEEVDRNTAYLFYQTLVGAWPWEEERAVAYMQKATREAKAHTSWIKANPSYDEAIERFVRGCFRDDALREEARVFVESIATGGYTNSLSQTLLKLTAPGVPDIYQGCELWDFSLVDPDNRRPVDYALRRELLARVKELSVEAIWEQREQGWPKLYLSHQALALRHRNPDAFDANSRYQPLSVEGSKSHHVVAFARQDRVAVVVPRLVLQLQQEWDNTTVSLPEGTWTNELTRDTYDAGPLALQELLRRFPVALLSRQDEAPEEA